MYPNTESQHITAIVKAKYCDGTLPLRVSKFIAINEIAESIKQKAVLGAMRLKLLPPALALNFPENNKPSRGDSYPKSNADIFNNPMHKTIEANISAELLFNCVFDLAVINRKETAINRKAKAVKGFIAASPGIGLFKNSISSCQPANTKTAISSTHRIRRRESFWSFCCRFMLFVFSIHRN